MLTLQGDERKLKGMEETQSVCLRAEIKLTADPSASMLHGPPVQCFLEDLVSALQLDLMTNHRFLNA